MNKSYDLSHLTGVVEDLLGKIADIQSVDVAALRKRVGRKFDDSQTALKKSGTAAVDRIRSTASAADGYVRANPWRAAAVLVGFAAAAAFIAGRARASK